MQALVKYATGQGNVALMEVPEPDLEPDTVLIDVAHVAICGTDRLAVEGAHDFIAPRILGHEASGTVRALGPDCERADLRIGDRVTVETDAYLCMECEYCRRREYNRCPHRKGIGTTANGALAEQLLVPSRAVHVLPDTVDLPQAALTEPLAIAVHAVMEQSPPLAGEVVVVVGPGAIGQLCAQVATAAGARVVVVGRSRHRDALALAHSLGAHRTVDAEIEDLHAVVHELSNGYGAHTVFECSGAPGVLEDSLGLLRRGGRAVLVAFYRQEPHVDIDAVINRELEIVGSRGKRPSSYETALSLLSAGKVRVEPLIGARLSLAEWRRGLELVAQGTKVVFDIAS